MSSATRYVLILIILLNLITLFLTLYFPPPPYNDDSHGSSTMVVRDGSAKPGAQSSPQATAPRPISPGKESSRNTATAAQMSIISIEKPLMRTTSPTRKATQPTMRPTVRTMSPTRKAIPTRTPTIRTMPPYPTKVEVSLRTVNQAPEDKKGVGHPDDEEEDAIDDQLAKHREEMMDEVGDEQKVPEDEDETYDGNKIANEENSDDDLAEDAVDDHSAMHVETAKDEDQDTVGDEVERSQDLEEDLRGKLENDSRGDEEDDEPDDDTEASPILALGGGEDNGVNGVGQEEDDEEEDAEALANFDSIIAGESSSSVSFMASSQQQRDCLDDYKRNRQSLGVKKLHPTVHDRLADLLARFSELSACKTSKKFVLLGTPHFGGGRILYDAYLRRRNWTNLRIDIPLSPKNISALDVIPKDTVLLLAACQRVLPVRYIQDELGVGVISMAPRERVHVLKIPFFLSIRRLFDEGLRCDYRAFHPETFLVESASQCRFFATTVLKRTNATDLWFIKSGRESFGDGIAVRTTEKALANEFSDDSCQMAFHNKGGPKIPRILIQRKVENILMVDERNTQGRSYFLISSYDPATVWFFMGYFNVAGSLANQSSADDKAAHVTNLRSNQDSKRLLFHEFMAGRTLEEMARLNDNIKRAALTAFLALKSNLGANRGSYSLFGFDFLVQTDLQVKVLETNCNCELFVDVKRFGKERVQLSTSLMKGMMDIVLAENLNREAFATLLTSFIQKNDMRSARDSMDVEDDGDQSERRRSWELIYTEHVKPPFMFATNASQLCGKAK